MCRLCRLISCPCLLTMMMMMMVMDGQQEHTTSQHTTHNTRVHKSIHHFRSPIPFLSPFWFNIPYTTFWPTVPKQKYCGLIEAFFQLDHSLSYHSVCSSSFHPPTLTHTLADRNGSISTLAIVPTLNTFLSLSVPKL